MENTDGYSLPNNSNNIEDSIIGIILLYGMRETLKGRQNIYRYIYTVITYWLGGVCKTMYIINNQKLALSYTRRKVKVIWK